MSFAEDLDLLGAEGLAGQYVVVRVKSIDKKKLGQAIGGGAAAAALPAALAVIDFAPQQVLSLILPLALERAKNTYGVELEAQVQDAPPPPGQKPPGGAGKVLVGIALGLGGAYAASHFGVVSAAQGAVRSVASRFSRSSSP